MAGEQLTSTFTHLRQQLLAVAERITGNRDDAADAVQDAFVRLWQHRIDTVTTQGLAVTTVRNVSIDHLRRAKVHPQVTINEQLDSAPEPATTWQEREEMLHRVHDIIQGELTPRERQVMQLRDVQGLTFEQVAGRLGMKPEAVRVELSRARKHVREIYRKKGEQE